MSEIKGYTAEEIAKSEKEKLIKDYDFIEHKYEEIRKLRKEIEALQEIYDHLRAEYRRASVNRVLGYIRSKKITDPRKLDLLLCHCQNKLNGNIDGVEIDLTEEL